jgi:L-fuculose-phosphate aldolase
MSISQLHPRDQIVGIISRIYRNGMTTTSGGNLSLLDEEGSIWITPKGIDKGALTPADIVCVKRDGTVAGQHEPSSEYPFHHAVYCARPDIKAIVHAHPPALAAFAITRRTPDTRILPSAFGICGTVGYAPYVLPGSRALGDAMAQKFSEGFSTVLMENHGIVTVGDTLDRAFLRLETLDFCARTELNARRLGGALAVAGGDMLPPQSREALKEFLPDVSTDREAAMRAELIRFMRRCYAQKLMTAGAGTCSARVDVRTFLITPDGADRAAVREMDLVLIRDGMKEAGREPDRNVGMHVEIYRKYPEVAAILSAQPPHIMAFGVSGEEFDSRTIPESYLVLKTVVKLPYPAATETIADRISEKTPIMLCMHQAVVVTGGSLLQCFDRLEVAEFSAQAIIASRALGPVVPMSDDEISELEKAFKM